MSTINVTVTRPVTRTVTIYRGPQGIPGEAGAAGAQGPAGTGSGEQSYQLENLSFAASVSSNALTLALKQQDGTNPASDGVVKIGFRSATLTSGAFNQREVTAATSLTVSSGSTLGHASGVAHYAYFYAIDSGGTVKLGVSSTKLDEGVLHTSVAEGGSGGADSASALYSDAVYSNVPIRLLGRFRSTQTTAGTWAAVPTEVSLVPFEETRIYAAYKSATSQTIPNGSPTLFDYDTKVEDTHNAVTTGTGWKFTAPKTGLYLINQFNVIFSTQFAAAKTLSSRLYKNGSQVAFIGRHLVAATVTENFHVYGSIPYPLSKGDYIDVRLYQDTGADKATEANALVNHIEVLYLGPI
jgi:hypothetical protein